MEERNHKKSESSSCEQHPMQSKEKNVFDIQLLSLKTIHKYLTQGLKSNIKKKKSVSPFLTPVHKGKLVIMIYNLSCQV